MSKDKFVSFLQDSHYHHSLKMKVDYPERRMDDRKLCLQNKQIGPLQLKTLLGLLSKNARSGSQRVVTLDLSQNDLGNQGVLLLARWLEKEQLDQGREADAGDPLEFASRRFSTDLSASGTK